MLLEQLIPSIIARLPGPVTGIVLGVLGLMAASKTRGYAFESASSNLPTLKVQPDENGNIEGKKPFLTKGAPIDTSKYNKEDWEGFTQSSAYELQSGQKKLYMVPVIGTGKNVPLAMTEDQAIEMGRKYQILKTLDKNFKKAVEGENKNEQMEIAEKYFDLEQDLNQDLISKLSNTLKKPDENIINYLKSNNGKINQSYGQKLTRRMIGDEAYQWLFEDEKDENKSNKKLQELMDWSDKTKQLIIKETDELTKSVPAIINNSTNVNGAPPQTIDGSETTVRNQDQTLSHCQRTSAVPC